MAVVGALKFVSISTGTDLSCGITSAGAAYCWGQSTEIGDGETVARTVFTPTRVSGGESFASISSARGSTGLHSCGITTAGDAYCWGQEVSGEDGDGNLTSTNAVPAPVLGGLTFAVP